MHSNRHAPSLDIAVQFAQYNCIQHLLSGSPLRLNVAAHSSNIDVESAKLRSVAFAFGNDSIINAGPAGLWRSVGKGPLSLINDESVIGSYLGLKSSRLHNLHVLGN